MANTLRDTILDASRSADLPTGYTMEEHDRSQMERGFDIGVNGLRRGVYGSVKMLGDSIGSSSLSEYGAEGARAMGEEAATLPPLAQPRASQVDWTDFGDVADFAGGALGLAAPSLAASVVGGAAAALTGGGALPVLAAAGLTSAVPEAGSTYLDIEEQTGVRAPGTAIATGAAAGALDAFGAGRVARASLPNSVIRGLIQRGIDPQVFSRLGLRETAASIPRRTLDGAATEFFTEGAQGAIGDFGRSQYIEGIDPLDMERRFDEAMIGLVGGGAVPLATNTAARGYEAATNQLDQRTFRQEQARTAANQQRAQDFDPASVTDEEPTPEATARRAREFNPEDVTTEEPGVAPQPAQEFNPEDIINNERVRDEWARSVVLTGKLDNVTNIEELPHIKEGGDGDIKYSRGLQAVERALSEGSLNRLLTPEQRDRAEVAAGLARTLLESPDTPMTPAQEAFIKEAFSPTFIRTIFAQAKAEDLTAARDPAAYDEAVNRRDDGGLDARAADPATAEDMSAIDLDNDNLTDLDYTDYDQIEAIDVGPSQYILPGTNGQPAVSIEGSQRAAAAAGLGNIQLRDSLAERVAEMNRQGDGRRFRVANYNEVVADELTDRLGRTPTRSELNVYKAQRAQELYQQISGRRTENTRFSVADLYDQENPTQFLENFSAIKQLAGGNVDREFSLPTEFFNVAKVERGNDGVFRGGERSVFRTRPKGSTYNPQASNIVATVDGRDVQLNLMNMINQFRSAKPNEAASFDVPVIERVKRDFSNAVASILSDANHRAEINFTAIPEDTVVYRTQDGLEITWKQIRDLQSPEQQAEDLRQRAARVERALDLEREQLEILVQQDDFNEVDFDKITARINRYTRQLNVLNRNAGYAQFRNETRGDRTADDIREEELRERGTEDVEREITGIIEPDTAPLEFGGARYNPNDSDVVASAALERINRIMEANENFVEITDGFKRFIDRVYDRLGLEQPSFYNLKNIRQTLARRAGGGTVNPAIPRGLMEHLTNDDLKRIALGAVWRDTMAGRGKPSRGDVQQAMDAYEDTRDEVYATRVAEYIIRAAEIRGEDYSARSEEFKALAQQSERALVDALPPEALADLMYPSFEVLLSLPGVQQNMQFANGAMEVLRNSTGIDHPAAQLLPPERFTLDMMEDGASLLTILKGGIGGYFLPSEARDGQPSIGINPFLNPLEAMQVLMHEYGHLLAITTDEVASLSPVSEVAALQDAMVKVNEEYNKYIRESRRVVSTGDIVAARKPALSARAAASHIPADTPFANVSEVFQEYFMSRDEWLADRIAALLYEDEVVGAAINEYMATLQNAYTNVLMGTFPETKDGQRELLNVWLPSARHGLEKVGEFMDGTNQDDPEILFSRALEATPRSETDLYAEMDRLVQDTLGINLGELANKWGNRLGLEPRQVLSKLIMTGMANRTEGMSLLHHQMMRYALTNMLTDREKAMLGRVATSPFVLNQIRARMAGSEWAMKLLADPTDGTEAAIAFAYQLATSDPTFKLGQAPRSLYQRMHRFFMKLSNLTYESDQAETAFEIFRQGKRARLGESNPPYGRLLYSQYEQIVFGPDAQNRNSAMNKISKWLQRADPITASQSKIRGFENPVLTNIARQFVSAPGESGIGQTYFEERQQMSGQFLNEVNHIMDTLPPEQVVEVYQLLHNYENTRVNASPQAQDAAENIFLLMDDMLSYYRKAGVEVGERGPKITVRGREIRAYFPWRFTPDALMSQLDRAIEVMHRPEYQVKLEELRKSWAPDGTIDDVINKILGGIMNADGSVDIKVDDDLQDFAPGMESIMTRNFWWFMEDSDADNPVSNDSKQFWNSLMDPNIFSTMESYIDQGVKRAAFVRRFGPRGEKLEGSLIRAREFGATDEEIKYAEHYVQAMLGSYGRSTHLRINTAINWASEKLGKGKILPEDPSEIINPQFAKAQQVMMAYQNIRLLDFAVFTSLVDPAGIAVRSGSIRNAWSSFRDGIRAWRKQYGEGNPDALASAAELLGITEKHLNNAAIDQEYGGNWMSGKVKQANDALFKYSGLSGWTRITRLMATSSAMKFLQFHTKNANREESIEFMNDLGLRPGDLSEADFDADGIVQLMSKTDRAMMADDSMADGQDGRREKTAEEMAADRLELARDDRIRNAIIRYTNEAILRPNAGQRPVWASDPHFAVVFHLKQFMWSFTTTIIGGAVNQAKNGRYAPMVLMGTLYPLGMGAADALRDWLRYGSEGAPSMQGADWSDYAMRAVQRAGLFGYGQLALDSQTDVEYGGVGFESFVGPTVTQAMDLLEVPLSSDKNLLDFIDRATPLQNTTKTLEQWVY